MFKKIFGAVFAVHLLLVAYFATGSKRADAPSPLPTLDELGPSAAAAPQAQATAKATPEPAPNPSSAPLRFSGDAASKVVLPSSIRLGELRSGIVYDVTAGRVLWSRDSAQPVPIASMTKMMTGLLALESIEQRGDLALETVVRVTEAAYRIGGSQVWLDPRESFALEALLISLFVHSANDSSYLIGEFVAGGDMSRFVARMNERAAELGMTGARFFNAHGLPEKEGSNVASCEDLVRLAVALLQHDEARQWASMEQYAFRPDPDNPTILMNHNRLLGRVAGVDGLKTGYTQKAGYCSTVSCQREGRRIVVVVTGFTSGRRRDECAQDLMEWAYQQ